MIRGLSLTSQSVRRCSKALAVLAGVVLMLSGCNANPTGRDPGAEPGPGERSAEEVFTDFMDAIDDTVRYSGTSWPEWDSEDTAGYVAEPCGVHERADGRLYQRQIEGGPVEDPQAAVDAMKAHWESKQLNAKSRVRCPVRRCGTAKEQRTREVVRTKIGRGPARRREARPYFNTIVLFPFRMIRPSQCQRTALLRALHSVSRPAATRSSGPNVWSTSTTCCEMIGPSSSSPLT